MSAFKSDMLFLLIVIAIVVSIVSCKFSGQSDNSNMLVVQQGVNTTHYEFKNPSSPKDGVVRTVNPSKFTKFVKTKDGHLYVYNNLICSANGVPLSPEGYIVKDNNNNYVIRYQTYQGKNSRDVDCGGIYPVINE